MVSQTSSCKGYPILTCTGLLPNAARPGSSASTGPDKQQGKIAAIRSELESTKHHIDQTVLKIQERGELMQDLQNKTGQSSPLPAASTRISVRVWCD